jgi:hypothetical protein
LAWLGRNQKLDPDPFGFAQDKFAPIDTVSEKNRIHGFNALRHQHVCCFGAVPFDAAGAHKAVNPTRSGNSDGL